MKDMTFDPTPAIEDFGWKPRDFHPDFDECLSGQSMNTTVWRPVRMTRSSR
jgi:hypothetical protein